MLFSYDFKNLILLIEHSSSNVQGSFIFRGYNTLHFLPFQKKFGGQVQPENKLQTNDKSLLQIL